MMKHSSSFIFAALLTACVIAGVLIWQQHAGEPVPAADPGVSSLTAPRERPEPPVVQEESTGKVENRPARAIELPAEAPPAAVADPEREVLALPGADDSLREQPQASVLPVPPGEPVPADSPLPADAQAVSSPHPESGTPDDPDAPASRDVPDKEVISGTVARGDTAGVLLNNWLSTNEVYSLLEVTRKVYSLSQIHEGQPYTLVRDTNSGEMESFEYEIDSNRKLIVLRRDEGFSATLENIPYETELALVEGSITSSLFQAMTDAGEQPALVMIIADIFAWEINFIKDLRVGDEFSILVEKRFREGEFRNYGKVIAATFTNANTKYEAYRFADSRGHFRFFNPKGESLEKTLLKAPLPFTRVTSGYSMRRFHPIFHTRRPHQGIDYGAPSGTPIKAVGSGLVTSARWVGGYGRQVVIRHSGRLESLYSHMSRYGRGIKAGVKVRQGQIIGYVGSSGNSTGPHLDFRLRQNGAFINPAKAINPRVDDLEKKRLPAFRDHMDRVRDYFTGKRALREYTADSP